MKKDTNTLIQVDRFVVRIIRQATINKLDVVSVVLFGSRAKEDADKSSDIDIIVIVHDESTNKQISDMKKYLYTLEEDIGLRVKASGLIGQMGIILDRIGAQYKSMFVCRRNDFINGHPDKIFHTESFFDRIILDNPLLRNDIGFKNILLSAEVIYGKDVLADLGNIEPILKKQLRQNLITYSILNLYALVVFPFTINSTKYSLSALKWTLHSCHFVQTRDPSSLSSEIEYFSQQYASKALNNMIELRHEYRRNYIFMLKTQLLIWQIFTRTLKETAFPVRLQ